VSLRHFSVLSLWLLCLFLLASSSLFGKTPVRGELRTGIYRGRPVTYTVIHGKAIYEGDILLERVDAMPGSSSGRFVQSVAYSNLWPKVGSVYQIPYTITNAATNLSTALTTFNSTFSGLIQFVPRTSETDFVDFNFDSSNHNGQCERPTSRKPRPGSAPFLRRNR